MKATSTVIVNPYDKNKLSALIKIDYYQPVRFNYTVHGKSNNVVFIMPTIVTLLIPKSPLSASMRIMPIP